MAANEFEKNMHKIMEEFRIHPSGDVWQNVEKRISEKKRKRRVLFFLLFSLLGTAIAGYGIYNYTNRKNPQFAIKNKSYDQSMVKKTNNTNTIREKNRSVKTNPSDELTISKKPADSNPISKAQNKKITKISFQPSPYNANLPATGQKSRSYSTSKKNKTKEKGETVTGSGQTMQDISAVDKKQTGDDRANGIIKTPAGKETATIKVTADTALSNNKENKQTEAVTQTKVLPKPGQSSKKLKWGLNFSSGISTIDQNLFFC